MRKHWAYLKYILRHKFYVFVGCRKIGVPIYLAIIHDWTKFLPCEWFPYANHFFNSDGTRRKVRDASGAYDPNSQTNNFKMAWLHHQKLKHHWQSWISIGNKGSISPMEWKEIYIREMIADWIGAGMAISGVKDPTGWYEKNADSLILHEKTRTTLEYLLFNYFEPCSRCNGNGYFVNHCANGW